jgi:Tfp pilus assembly protein PilO
MDLRERVKTWTQRPVTYVRSEWNRMAPRERRLVGALGAAVVGFAILVTGLLIVQSLREIDQNNEDAREALAAIAKNRDVYLEAKDKMVAQEMRIGTEPPQLLGDLEAAAREAGFQLNETSEIPAQPAGKRYLEHGVRVKIRDVDLKSVSKFLAAVETNRRMIVVSRLSMRRRYSAQAEKMDVELTATAWERLKENRPVKKKPGQKGKS